MHIILKNAFSFDQGCLSGLRQTGKTALIKFFLQSQDSSAAFLYCNRDNRRVRDAFIENGFVIVEGL